MTWKAWAELDATPYPSGYAPLGVAGGLSKSTRVIRQIADLARESGSAMYLLIYPHPAQLAHPSTVFDWERYANDACHEAQCAGVIDTFPAFESVVHGNHPDADWYRHYFVEGDAHFNVAGNRLVADEIVKRLLPAQAR